MILDRQHPSEREEVVLLGKPLPHAHESPAKQILAGEVIHAWEMIDLLVEFHLGESLRLYCIIRPADIPIHGVGRGLSAPSEMLGNLAHHWILTVWVDSRVPEMLMTILFVFFCFGFLGIVLRPGEAQPSSDSD